MTALTEIDKAIANVTGTRHSSLVTDPSVWIYGQMVWAELPLFRFVACRGTQTREIRLMADQLKRYRDGDTAFFLIEMPRAMADALELENFILPPGELDRLKQNIDTTRAW